MERVARSEERRCAEGRTEEAVTNGQPGSEELVRRYKEAVLQRIIDRRRSTALGWREGRGGEVCPVRIFPRLGEPP